MRVEVTGGSGVVGGWSAAALAGAGHDVRLLVRAPERLVPVAALGVDTSDQVVGDVSDAAARAAGRLQRVSSTDEPWPNRPWFTVIPTLASVT
jgi:uncharacterized protein YbjT (DUF2867 family)